MPLIERIIRDNIVLYCSPRLTTIGVPHAFTTRIGGVSQGPFASLNLGNPNGQAIQDTTENIANNYLLVHQAIAASDRQRCYVHQVHSDRVEVARCGEHFDTSCKADAVVTNDRRRLAAVRVADCVPVLLASADGTVVAAIHAGWRGVIAGVVHRGIDALRNLAPATDRIMAAIGPAISFSQFEVGPEVASEFQRVFSGDAADLTRAAKHSDKAYIDLQAAILLQLQASGVSRSDTDTNDHCTIRDADEFFSHRRDNGLTGRMAALIGPV